MKFKAEMCLLLVAIALFASSVYFYSYQPSSENLTYSITASFPYRMQALALVGFGSLLTLTASISYSRRSKSFVNTGRHA